MNSTKMSLLIILSFAMVHSLQDEKDPIVNYSALENPFRSQKCNLLWDKARTKLSSVKLKQLHTELKVHDKETMSLKKLKADGMDKEGLKEAEIRKRFNSIMFSYGLAKSTDTKLDESKVKTIFKDKKLERLWQKAHKVGLEEEELILLKKEFQHHQEKLDQFHQLKELQAKTKDGNLMSNHIDLNDESTQFDENTLNGKSKALKEDYDRLHRLATNSQPSDFREPKVSGLWKLAQEADFNDEELESLQKELSHFEKRIEKLHHLQAEQKLVDSRHKHFDDTELNNGMKTDGRKKMDRKLEKTVDSIDKMHAELAARIASRHSEL